MPTRLLTAATVVVAAAGLFVATNQGQTTSLVTHVNPRPRLMFAPGEYERFVSETTGSRQSAFDRMTAEIDNRGSKNWNERDIQLESQALAARVLLDRGDDRGARYLGLARQSMTSLTSRHTYTNWSDSHDIVTEGGRWIEAVSLAHDWLHDRWTPDERERMQSWLDAEIDDWVGRNRLARASSSPFRNDAARGTAALILAGITLFDEPGHEGSARQALAHAEPYYDAIVAAHTYAGVGGGMVEGTFYGNFTAWAQTLIAEALYTGAGVTDAYTRTPFYRARLRYATFASWPGYLTNQFGYNVHQLAPVFGDARRGPTGSALYHRAIVLLLGKRFPDDPAARAAYWAVNRPETSRTYIAEWSLYDVLCWSPQVNPTAPTDLAYREPSLGQVFARSDWTDSAMWLSFNAGPHLDTHQHYDAGNLTIFKRTDLVVDSGTFDAFGSSHWYNYYVRTTAHNTITVLDPSERLRGIWSGVPDNRAVNDGGQRTAYPLTPAPTLDEYLANRVAYDQGAITHYGQGPWGVYMGADLTNAYQNARYQSTRPGGGRNTPKVTHVGRDVVYLRATAGARDAVVVFDRVVATDAHFKKAVLWHSREPFGTGTVPNSGTGGSPTAKVTTVSEGETRYAGASRYDFVSDVTFDQKRKTDSARLFVTVLAVDPVNVRQLGRRPSIAGVDHTTFGTAHHHRHVQDYLVEDPRGLTNTDASLGAAGRPEWPPFNAPEVQWLFTDDLVGGWGQTRLQIEPDQPRAADRFLTVLVPSDAGTPHTAEIALAPSGDGGAAGVVIREGPRNEVVIFGADPNGGDLTSGSVDVPTSSSDAMLTVVALTPGAHYSMRVGGSGPVQRVGISRGSEGALVADEGGMIRVRLSTLPRTKFFGEASRGAVALGAGVAASAAAGTAGEGPGAGGQSPSATSKTHPGLTTLAVTDPADVMSWDRRIQRMVKTRELVLRESTPDALVQGRVNERYTQMYRGVPVFGGDVSRQVEEGRAVSLFGTLYGNITLDPRPALSVADAADTFQKLAGGGLGPSRSPELMVLPTDDGSYRLTYRARIATADDVIMTFIDAANGATVLSFSDLKRPAR